MGTDRTHEIATLVVRHRVKAGSEDAYEIWLRRTIDIASRYVGHMGVDVIRSRHEGLALFTCVLRFSCTLHLQAWLDSTDRHELVDDVAPLLADGDHTDISQAREFWFVPPADQPQPPRWKQACVTFLVILPLSLLVPLLWQPLFASVPPLGGYVASNVLITLSIVLLVVYLFMPLATRLFSRWLNP
ncbi:antibiotic biosynthesis monooxygenase [Pseudomonas sp. GD03944]|uniref:antibiotic biosynthesis monooxygenase n=1 Tax=Pseudomonas sp. GD03944 TaxID=2975409 RepID=UPI002449DB88|nr:antibiotic biosynthesis monooxygenase [Pseudomonas sp. GD03944]MDH1264949.1 antibiotic biosynthesis monooxygenase [Pseudomonas sp. GD03944]HWV08040.1 antibiotic biosynthesis monooxygenase [Pseudomonas sp.]